MAHDEKRDARTEDEAALMREFRIEVLSLLNHAPPRYEQDPQTNPPQDGYSPSRT